MSDVAAHLRNLIRTNGPISVAEFMRIVLTARDDSYYQRADPFGASGDFVTSPEISQIFGELIGLWCADTWQKAGGGPVTLVELGPGRGTLMRDVLRAARVMPGFLNAANVAMVEVSERLRVLQRDAVKDAGVPVRWFDAFEDVDVNGTLIVVANEFFDALPIRQFVRGAKGWSERCVGLRGDALMFGAAPDIVEPHVIAAPLRDEPEGAIVEVSPARSAVARSIGKRLAVHGGAAVVIDYGFAGPASGDTLQAVKAHAFAGVLAEPGEADVTSHVDFAALAEAFAAGGAAVTRIITQGDFLTALGAFERTTALKRKAGEAQARELDAAYARLTGPDAMGTLFKVVCAYGPSTVQPVGF